MHGFGFFPGILWPVVLFFGLLKLLFVVLIIGFIVRLAMHGRGHYHGYGWGHGQGHGHGYGYGGGMADVDPRRIAAWRYAAGKIDRAEFDRIVAGLDASAAAGPTTPPAGPPQPQA